MRIKTVLSLLAAALLAPFILSFTAPQECDNCIAVYGDSQVGHETHEKVVESIMSFNPGVVFHTGDMVEDGLKEEEWDTFNSITSTLRDNTEFYPAFGNHEQHSGLFFTNFPYLEGKSWYIRQAYGINFIVLDSTSDLGPGSGQTKWLESELDTARQNDEPVVVFMHYPPFNTGLHARETGRLQKGLVPLFDKYGVVAVFSGHDHDYQHFVHKDTHYIVFGGGGGRLYDQAAGYPEIKKFVKTHGFSTLSINDGRLIVRAYDPESKLIDEVVIDMEKRAQAPVPIMMQDSELE